MTAPKKGDPQSSSPAQQLSGGPGMQQQKEADTISSTAAPACPTWNPSCSDELQWVRPAQTQHNHPHQSHSSASASREGLWAQWATVRQQHSQGFFVHYLLNHSPSWSIFSLVMHYLQMLVETKSTLDVPISFLPASQDTDSVVIFC